MDSDWSDDQGSCQSVAVLRDLCITTDVLATMAWRFGRAAAFTPAMVAWHFNVGVYS
jgi:hypothetical protein